jgi:hypothetical protein
MHQGALPRGIRGRNVREDEEDPMSIPGSRNPKMVLAVAAAIVGLLETGCDSQEVLDAFGADVPLHLEVTPPALTLEVDRSASLGARLNGSTVDAGGLGWLSDNPQVATVDATGRVTCVGVGTARITATLDNPGANDASAGATVNCVGPRLIALDTDSIRQVHVVGQSPCPDRVGQFTIANRSTRPVTVEVDLGAMAPLRSSVRRVRLGPDQSAVVELDFDCSVRSSFQAQATVTATDDDGRTQTATVAVEVTVQG